MRVDVHRTRLSRVASDHYPLIARISAPSKRASQDGD
jgi:endonuclease/exonuclease/phosphatase family metal-dependent hydrolase